MNAVLESDTRQLLGHFFRLITGDAPARRSQSPALRTMKRVVEALLEKHRISYNGMLARLSVGDREDDMAFVSSIARSMFQDGITNWGRVAGLVAFGAAVCQHLKAMGRENCVVSVEQQISTYLLTHQRDWLLKNNAWAGFVDFFRVQDPESTLLNMLMALAGLAGLGATLALCIKHMA